VRSFAALRKEAGLFCGSFLRKGEVFAYVGKSKPEGPKELSHLIPLCAFSRRVVLVCVCVCEYGNQLVYLHMPDCGFTL
jgi:hypothetical protein